MASKGSALRAEGNETLRTLCSSCGKSISTEVGHAHPFDENLRREAWGLLGRREGRAALFAACSACHDLGWRPPHYREFA